MPFTPSHAAALIPFKYWRCRLSSTAFVVGSMVPDFENFLLLRNTDKLGHTLPGVLILDLPLGLLLCCWFHLLTRQLVIQLLPPFYQQRVAVYMSFNWLHYFSSNKLLVVQSLLLGIISHLVWDDFTHENSICSIVVPAIDHHIEWLGYTPVFFVVQVVSSLMGLFLVHWYIGRKPVQPILNQTHISFFDLSLIAAIAAGILLVRIIAMPQYNSTSDLIKAFFGALFYAVTICGIKECWVKRIGSTSIQNR